MRYPTNPSTRAASFPKALGILAVFAITTLAAMIPAGIYCYDLPRLFLSQVKIEIPTEPLKPFAPREVIFQQIQSKQTIYPVIEALKLEEKWKAPDGAPLLKNEIYERLAGKIEVTPIRNTHLIEISVLLPNRVEAADIANQIAEQIQKQQIEQRQEALEAGLGALKEEVESQRKATETARAEMVKLREENQITDPEPEQLSVRSFSELQPEKMEAEKRYMNAKESYLNHRKLLEAVETRLATEKLQVKTQAVPPKIREKAEPSIYPYTPSQQKLTAIMVGSTVFGGFMGAVAALTVGLSLRRRS